MEKQLQKLILEALKKEASDIHFRIEQNQVTIQFRTLNEMVDAEQQCSINLFRYLQYRANLDVSNVLKPQTGQFEMEINRQIISLRFSILNSISVTSGVLRILNAEFSLIVDDLTMNLNNVEKLKRFLHRRHGLILLSGPTGSGKTTTLYTLLNAVKKRKIFTLEDPIEIYSPHFVQLQINEKQNLDYKEGIRQLLRHDPDIIVLGEIRDEQAAAMAVRSALTGHLVISTIHAFSCASAIERMLELKVSERQLKDVLVALSNQRLYSAKKKGKTGVYEIMERKQITAFFEGKELEDFTSLHEEIESAVSLGFIEADQAEIDLF